MLSNDIWGERERDKGKLGREKLKRKSQENGQEKRPFQGASFKLW